MRRKEQKANDPPNIFVRVTNDTTRKRCSVILCVRTHCIISISLAAAAVATDRLVVTSCFVSALVDCY